MSDYVNDFDIMFAEILEFNHAHKNAMWPICSEYHDIPYIATTRDGSFISIPTALPGERAINTFTVQLKLIYNFVAEQVNMFGDMSTWKPGQHILVQIYNDPCLPKKPEKDGKLKINNVLYDILAIRDHYVGPHVTRFDAMVGHG